MRGLTLESLAERIGATHSTLSRVERGLQPYNQDMLEMLAVELQCSPADLLVRHPLDPDGIWAVWAMLPPRQRAQAIRLLKALIEQAA